MKTLVVFVMFFALVLAHGSCEDDHCEKEQVSDTYYLDSLKKLESREYLMLGSAVGTIDHFIFPEGKSNEMSILEAVEYTLERQISVLPKGMIDSSNVLMVGSNMGASARYLSRKYDCFVTCYHGSKKHNKYHKLMSELSFAGRSGGEVVRCDVSKPPLPSDDDQFSLAFANDVGGHLTVEDKLAFFKEIHRSIAQNGYLLMTDFHETAVDHAHDAEFMKHMITFGEQKKLLEEAGFEDVKKYTVQTADDLESFERVLKELKSGTSCHVLRETLNKRERDTLRTDIQDKQFLLEHDIIEWIMWTAKKPGRW